jgi:hypothetical protein
MSTLSRHLSPDDRRLHLVSLFQSVNWNLLFFLTIFTQSLSTTRYGVSNATSPDLANRDTGVFGDFLELSYCTIPWSGRGRFCSLVGWLVLPTSVRGGFGPPSCGAHIANCLLFPSFSTSNQYLGGGLFQKSVSLHGGQWVLD